MTLQEIQAEADYRWIERAGIYAGNRPLTEQERKLIQEEIQKFEESERKKSNAENIR